MKLFFYCIILSVTTVSWGQNSGSPFIQIKFGSSQTLNSITQIVQDKYGFIWLATKSGLIKYDGYDHKLFVNDHLDSKSISGNFIRDIIEDKNGLIWVATDNNGISIYSHDSGNFTQISTGNLTSTANVWTIIEDNKYPGEIFWIGTTKGLIKFDYKNNRTEKILLSDPSASIVDLLEDSQGNLWIGTNHGLFIHNKIKEIKHFTSNGTTGSLGNNFIWKIYEDINSDIWMGTRLGGLNFFAKNDSSFITYTFENNSVPDNRILDITESKSYPGKLVLALWDSGLYLFDPRGKHSTNLISEAKFNNLDGLTLFKDKLGILWFGTEDEGVFFQNIYNDNFRLISGDFKSKQFSITSIVKTDDDILAGSTIGLFNITEDKLVFPKTSDIFPDEILMKNIQNIIQDKKGNLIIATFFNGLYVLSQDVQKKYRIIKRLLNTKTINASFIDSKNNLWVSAHSYGIYKYSDNFSLKKHYVQADSVFLRAIFTKTYEKSDGNILFGTTRFGYFEYSPLTDTFTQHKSKNNDNKTLNNNSVSSFLELNNGDLLIGTNGGGINFKKKSDEQFTYIKSDKWLMGDDIKSIIAEDQRIIWAGTDNGLLKIDMISGSIYNFNIEEGLPGLPFQDNTIFKDAGDIFLSVKNGLIKFSPSNLVMNEYSPKPIITQIKVLNKIYDNLINPYTKSEWYFDYPERTISFEITSLNYISANDNQYMYRLSGINDEWQNLGNERILTFVNLVPGNYRLEFRSTNNDGLLSEEINDFTFNILPPFWMQWWFIVLIVVLILGVISFIVYIRFRSILQIEKLRTKIASDLHDEVGSSVSKISIIANLLKYESERTRLESKLDKLNVLSNEIVNSMNDVVWSIDARNDSVNDLIDYMKNFAITFAAEKDIEINFDTENLKPHFKIPLNYRQNIYMIFKETVNNAIKYSGSGMFDICIKFDGHTFGFRITDHGSGFGENKGRGHGLQNIKMRADSIKAKLLIIEENGITINLIVKIR